MTYDEAVKRLGRMAAKRAGIDLDDVVPADEFWPEMQALADAVCLREMLAVVEAARVQVVGPDEPDKLYPALKAFDAAASWDVESHD